MLFQIRLTNYLKCHLISKKFHNFKPNRKKFLAYTDNLKKESLMNKVVAMFHQFTNKSSFWEIQSADNVYKKLP